MTEKMKYRGPRRFNTIHHNYIDDLREADLTVNAIAVEMYLMLSSSSNMAGVWRESPYTIAQYVSLEPEEVKEALSYLAASGRVFLFAGDWIFLPSKWRFDSAYPGTESQIKGIASLLAIAPSFASDAFKLFYRDFQTRLVTILTEDLHNPAVCNTGGTRNTGTGTGTGNPLSNPSISDSVAIADSCQNLPPDPSDNYGRKINIH